MAKNYGSIWGVAHFSTPRLSFEEAFAGVDPEDNTIVDPQTGETVDYDEEYTALAVETAEIAQDIETVADTNEAMDQGETLAQIGDAIEQSGREATPEEAALIQTGVSNVLDKTGAPEEVVEEVTEQVATESASGSPVLSMEGFKDVLLRMWQATKEFVAGIIARIKDAWRRFWNSTAGVVKAAEKLAKRAEGLEANPEAKIEKWSGIFKLLANAETKSFSIEDAVKDISVLKKEAAECGKLAQEASNTIHGKLDKVFGSDQAELIEIVKDIAKDVTSRGKSSLTDKIKNFFRFSKKVEGTGTKFRFGGAFQAYVADTDYLEGDNKNEVAYINSIKVLNGVDTKALSEIKKEGFSEAPLTPAQVVSLVGDVKDVAKALDKFYNTDSKKAHEAVDKIRKAVDEKVKALGEEATDAQKHAAKVAQRLYYVPTQLFRGEMDRCMYVIRTAKAFLSLGGLCLSKAKKKEAK